MRPMLASRGKGLPPDGPEWLHEVKWDGMRVLVEVKDGRLRLYSRNENDVTVSFPELLSFADHDVCGGRDILLDAEVVAFDDSGIPRFGALADRMHVQNPAKAEQAAARNPVTLLLFDLLAFDGQDLTSLPLRERRKALESLHLEGDRWRVPPAYDDGRLLLEATGKQGLEGVVSKRRSSTYRFGQRTESWLKFPHRAAWSCLVGGWRFETGSSSRIGAVLVGEPTADGLLFRGKVGSGIAGAAGFILQRALEPLSAASSPFDGELPRADVLGTNWVRPELIVEVESLGLTPGGRLRQPAYVGIRRDLSYADLVPDG
jgi:bifunctional non-homologous end joining protein LigD